MSQETVESHWGRHHREHLNSLNTHIIGSELNDMPLEEIIVTSYNKGDWLPVFIHAAQVKFLLPLIALCIIFKIIWFS